MIGLKRKQVDGLTDFLSLVDILKQGGASRVFVLFCGNRDEETGESWCSDCVKADSVINKVVSEQTDDNATLIVCTVGDKPSWKDPNNPFRTHKTLKLTGVPTLMEWDTPKRLGPEECAKTDLVQLLFEE